MIKYEGNYQGPDSLGQDEEVVVMIDGKAHTGKVCDFDWTDVSEYKLKGNADNLHYTQGSISTRDKRSKVAAHLEKMISNDEWDDASRFLEYFDRMGQKQYPGMSMEESIEKDAYKCADYLFRFKNDVFLNEIQQNV